MPILLILSLLLLVSGEVRAQQTLTPPTVLDNGYVTVTKNAAPCGASSPRCADRVVVAMGDVEVRSGGTIRALERGEVAVFQAGESYEVPPEGPYYEVAFKPGHPPVRSPRAADLIPPDQNVTLYDGPRFFVFSERLPVGGYRARHGHSQRVVIQLNATRLRQKPDGQPEVTRDIVPDRPAFNDAIVHDTRNVGDQPLDGIVIEFRPEPGRGR